MARRSSVSSQQGELPSLLEDEEPLAALRKEAEGKVLEMVYPPEPVAEYVKADPEALKRTICAKSRRAWHVKGLVAIMSSIACVTTLPHLEKDPAKWCSQARYRLVLLGCSTVVFLGVLLTWNPRINSKPPKLNWLWQLVWFTVMHLAHFIWHASHSVTQVTLFAVLQLLISILVTADTYFCFPKGSVLRAWFFAANFVIHLVQTVCLVLPLARSGWSYGGCLVGLGVLHYAASVTHFRADLARHCLERKTSLSRDNAIAQFNQDECVFYCLSIAAVLDYFYCHDKSDFNRIAAQFSAFVDESFHSSQLSRTISLQNLNSTIEETSPGLESSAV